jgi:hypothetical protein
MIRKRVNKRIVLSAAIPLLASATAPDVGYAAVEKLVARQDHTIGGPVTTVGNPKSPDSLGQELTDAYNRGARRISIRVGTYQFSLSGHPILDLSHWKDVKITGHSAILISSETEWGNELIRMDSCSNVEIDDLTLSQTWQPALQGKVTSVSEIGDSRTQCVWQPDPGYPIPDAGATHFNKGPNIVDAKTRLLKHGCGDEWNADLEPSAGGGYRVTFGHRVNLAAGDWLVASGKAAPCKVHVLNSHGCTLSNVTLLRNAFASVFEENGGGNSYYDCHWLLGPKPTEALDKPLVSCSADGFHSVGAYPGPDIENCDFSGVLLGDCITVHGSLQQVKGSSGDTIVVDQDGGNLKADQPIRIGAPGFFENGFVKSIHPNGDHTVTVTLDRILNVPVGARVGNPLFNGQSFKVLGCHIGGTRSRGILVKADSGLIANNVIGGCGMSGISVGPEYEWKEGDYVQDLSVKDNQFGKNGFAGGDLAAILIHGEGAKGNRNLTIEGNTFDSDYSGDIDLQWTMGAIIRQNSFTPPDAPPPGLSAPHAISVRSSSDVQIQRNQFKGFGYRNPRIYTGADVQGMHVDGGE